MTVASHYTVDIPDTRYEHMHTDLINLTFINLENLTIPGCPLALARRMHYLMASSSC